MDDDIVPAHPDDAPEAAHLIAETDRELFHWYTGDDLDLWVEIAECEWRAADGISAHGACRIHSRGR